jgi:hypothetical protein
VERNDGNDDNEEKRNQFGDCGDDVDEGCLLYAFQDQKMDEPQANGSADD